MAEPKLRDLLDQGKVDLEVDNPPLLTLATGWPAGLEMLLKAGAEPFAAIEEAIRQEQLQSISLLLDHGCPMFGPDTDLVDFAVDSLVSPNVILLLIERLAGRRQELLQLALDHLPEAVIETSWCNYHVQPRPLLDYNAVKIYDQLKTHCVEVSEALWPGPYTTIYHSPSVHNSSSLAMKLYELGFRDIDKPDDQGTTPLVSAIEACGCENDDCTQLIQWYMDLGVTLGPRPFLTHILNRSIYFPTTIPVGLWSDGRRKLDDMLKIFRQLVHGDAQKNDDCRCWCSTTGCTPVGVVLRKGSFFLIEDSRGLQLLIRRRWLYLLPRDSWLGLALDQDYFAEICKLEIFDRLGMAHTCCHRSQICPKGDFPITSDERKELQEEDQGLKKALDLYVELYLDLLQQHQGSFESFWISWWFSMDHLLPFDRPTNSEDYFHPLHLPGFPKDEPLSKGDDATGYSPDITALTSAVHSCVTLLKPKAIDTFLNQLNAVSLERSIYQQTILKPMGGTQHGNIYLD